MAGDPVLEANQPPTVAWCWEEAVLLTLDTGSADWGDGDNVPASSSCHHAGVRWGQDTESELQ